MQRNKSPGQHLSTRWASCQQREDFLDYGTSPPTTKSRRKRDTATVRQTSSEATLLRLPVRRLSPSLTSRNSGSEQQDEDNNNHPKNAKWDPVPPSPPAGRRQEFFQQKSKGQHKQLSPKKLLELSPPTKPVRSVSDESQALAMSDVPFISGGEDQYKKKSSSRQHLGSSITNKKRPPAKPSTSPSSASDSPSVPARRPSVPSISSQDCEYYDVMQSSRKVASVYQTSSKELTNVMEINLPKQVHGNNRLSSRMISEYFRRMGTSSAAGNTAPSTIGPSRYIKERLSSSSMTKVWDSALGIHMPRRE